MHTIDLEKCVVYEVGAFLLALLAYPEENQGRQLADLHVSLCAIAVRLINAANPHEADRPQPIKPAYAFRSERQIRQDWRTFERRIRDRMIAGRMVMAFLKEASTGQLPDLDGIPGRGLSINRVAALVSDNEDVKEPENIETRIWRPSIPVLHLAAAIAILGSELKRICSLELAWVDLLLHRPFIEWVISSAAEIEELIDKSKHLPVKREDLIQLRLAS